MGLASCDDKSDLGVMQVNPQETVMSAGGVSVSMVSPANSPSFSISSYEGGIIPVVTYSFDETVPENAEIEFDMDLAKNPEYTDAITIPMVRVNETTFGVKASDWDDAFRHIFGKSPYAKENYIRVAGYLNIGMQHSRIGGADTWFGNDTRISVTPIDLNINVEEAYYLVGTVNGWNLAEPVKFNHSDLSQFDDPVFTLAIDIPAETAADGWWWKIVPESAFQAQDWDSLFGTATDGDSSLSGVLFAGGKAGCLKVAGQYLFSINMLDQTYEVSQAIPMLYTPGGGNGWGFASGMLKTWDYANYFGFTHLSGDFKVTDRPSWGGMEWGAGDEEGKLKLGGGNVPGPANGLYWMDVNIGALTYSFLPINSIGMIGSFPENNWASDYVELTPSDDLLTWTANVKFTSADTEWKFRTNGDWGANPNLGNTYDDLEKDGGNMPAPGVGTYKVTLNLSVVPYTCSFEKISD